MEKTISKNWDLDSIYSDGSQSADLQDFMKQLALSIKEIQTEMKTIQTHECFSVSTMVNLLRRIQSVMEGTLQVDEFLICLTSNNVEDHSASGLVNESARLRSSFEILLGELDHLLASMADEDWNLLINNEEVTQYRFFLEERKQQAKEKLSLPMEQLIHTLSVNGFTAWENHYDQQIAQLKIPLEKEGEIKELTLTEAYYEILTSTDRSHKQDVMNAYNEACEKVSDTYASILNSISGFRLDVYKQRGWDNILKEALDQNRIKQSTLNTMMAVIKSNYGLLHRFLKRKAELSKVEKLKWFEIPANTFTTEKTFTYEETREIIVSQFHGFSEKLGNFAEKTFEERWIEAEDRRNKAGGAFCASMPLQKESRILMTFKGTYHDIITLAHELGHAYHNFILDEEPAFARKKGTSVAESASTFCENLVLDAALSHAEDKKERLSLLESKISAGMTYLGLIPARFQFEQNLYEKRKEGLLSSQEITGLMAAAETDIYGEHVDGVHEYSWVTTSHLYSTEKAFYNIPYTIGYLFSNGVYSLAKKQGDSFIDQYDELLRNSGRMTVEQLAEFYLNEDLTQESFWKAAIQPVAEAIDEYIKLSEDLI
ncbi:M3 family oligoendopeptidase [Bacillus sp. SG-1]|uniref:M3 family oligoendopeptidase n=1 Tax=Bacillus sp. SG-1 TaxID=161544 RepID=UPI0002E08FF3|nr:M3 family oligoendopeptidase [Bacillus sp. SG-1]